MDCSNPVIDATRKPIGEMVRRRQLCLRQDLAYLKMVGAKGRVPLSSQQDPPKELVDRAVDRIPIPEMGVRALKDIPLKKIMDFIPVSDKEVNGRKIHPPGKNQQGGHVSVKRQFGKTPSKRRDLVQGLVRSFPLETVVEQASAAIFTSGTSEGFENRLGLLTSNKSKSIHHCHPSLKAYWKNPLVELDRLMPVGDVPNWNDKMYDDLASCMKEVVTSSNASAGAPYWRSKGDCMEDIFSVITDMSEALLAGPKELKRFFEDDPELLVFECKNKEDRYDVDKLMTKTRPYFNTPSHISLPVSFIMQKFTKALHNIGTNKHTVCAYGFSMANGGGRAVFDRWNAVRKDGRTRFHVYGDDVDIMAKIQGKVYRISPDIKQMDSCVDFDTIKLTLRWVASHFHRKGGKNDFWESILAMYEKMLESPHIMIEGETVYTKSPDGLMSGVVGTTLIGCVKAAISYSRLVQFTDLVGREKLLDHKFCSKWLLEWCGLVVKEGTWVPEEINFDLDPILPGEAPRSLPSSNKFLGVRYLPALGPNGVDWVPYLTDDEWVRLFVTPRDSVERSATALKRTHFERMRGYLITGAIFSPVAKEYCYAEIDTLPDEVILMETQNHQAIESIILGQEEPFIITDSQVIPTWEWVFNIYSHEENKYDVTPLYVHTDDVRAKVCDILKIPRQISGIAMVPTAIPHRYELEVDITKEKVVDPPQFPCEANIALPEIKGPLPDFSNIQPSKRYRTPQDFREYMIRVLEELGGVAKMEEVMERTGLTEAELRARVRPAGFALKDDWIGICIPDFDNSPKRVVEEQENIISVCPSSPVKSYVVGPPDLAYVEEFDWGLRPIAIPEMDQTAAYGFLMNNLDIKPVSRAKVVVPPTHETPAKVQVTTEFVNKVNRTEVVAFWRGSGTNKAACLNLMRKDVLAANLRNSIVYAQEVEDESPLHIHLASKGDAVLWETPINEPTPPMAVEWADGEVHARGHHDDVNALKIELDEEQEKRPVLTQKENQIRSRKNLISFIDALEYMYNNSKSFYYARKFKENERAAQRAPRSSYERNRTSRRQGNNNQGQGLQIRGIERNGHGREGTSERIQRRPSLSSGYGTDALPPTPAPRRSIPTNPI